MTDIASFDHIALAVPDLNEQVERFTTMMGMVVVQRQGDAYALIADPGSGFKIELSRSDDGEAHFRIRLVHVLRQRVVDDHRIARLLRLVARQSIERRVALSRRVVEQQCVTL